MVKKMQSIEFLINKHRRNFFWLDCTSFKPLKEQKPGHSICFEKNKFVDLREIFDDANLDLVPESGNKLNTLFRSTKDPIDKMDKPGIYSAKYNIKNCNSIYIGQTQPKTHSLYVNTW